VSMARVAREVGFTTMSLYRHIANKDELLALMWNASAREIHDFQLEGSTWRERLRCWAMVQRRVIEENIWIVQLPMATPPLSPTSLAWVELGLEAMSDLAVGDYAKIRVLGLISQHALIDARIAFDERRGKSLAAASGVETDYGALVRALADPEVYPHLTRTANEEPPPGFAADPYFEFDFDIGIILDGFEMLATRTAT
jgi:AcrR family transcriptional regulator